MSFVNFVLAISPIVVVMAGIMGFKKPAMKVAPVALVWTVFLALTYFNITDISFKENVVVLDALLWKGIKEGFKIVVMVFGAFVILNTLKRTGAIDDVKNTVTQISGKDRRVQLIIVGILVPIFLEGAAGAGAPAAIASPFLVALGFDPIRTRPLPAAERRRRRMNHRKAPILRLRPLRGRQRYRSRRRLLLQLVRLARKSPSTICRRRALTT